MILKFDFVEGSILRIKTNAIWEKDLVVESPRQWRARRAYPVESVYQCAEVGRGWLVY